MSSDVTPPGIFRFQVGDCACLILRDDDTSTSQVAQNYRRVAPEAVERLLAEQQTPSEAESVLAAVLIDTPTHRLLIDAGAGNLPVPEEAETALRLAASAEAAPGAGRLRQRLAQLGIVPESIDLVLLTHLHPDHVAGLVTSEGDLAYPAAWVVCSRREVDFWRAPDLGQMLVPAAFKDLLAELGMAFLHRLEDRLLLIDPTPAQEVVPGIEAFATPGHTPGHLAYQLTSEGQTLQVMGDALEHPVLSLAQPEWPCDLDTDPAQASLTAQTLLERAATSGDLLAAYHFPWPSVGRVVRTAAGYRWQPLSGALVGAVPARGVLGQTGIPSRGKDG